MKDMRPRDPRELSELLRRTAPDGPDPAGRADEVRRRGRRATRRRGTVSAVAVGAVALTVIVGPHLLPGSPVSNDASPTQPVGLQPSVANNPPGNSARSFTCATEGHPLAPATPVRDGTVPNGAVLARICDGGGSSTVPWQAPIDPLVTNVDAVAAAFNSAPPGKAIPCPASLNANSFTLTFQYADGRLARVSGVADSCGFAALQGTPGLGRFAAWPVMTTYFRMLETQRASMTPPASATSGALTCPKTATTIQGLIPPATRLDMTKAIICRFPGTMPVPRHPYPLTSAQVRAIDDDYATSATKVHRTVFCDGPMGPTEIIGETAWGDRVVLYAAECSPWSRGQEQWTPSDTVAAMIDSALGH